MSVDTELFVVHWPIPVTGATMPTLCEYCGATRYSAGENIEAARRRGMKTACPKCAMRLMSEEGGEVGGRVRNGKVIEK